MVSITSITGGLLIPAHSKNTQKNSSSDKSLYCCCFDVCLYTPLPDFFRSTPAFSVQYPTEDLEVLMRLYLHRLVLVFVEGY